MKRGNEAKGKRGQKRCRQCRRVMRKRKAYLFCSMVCIGAYENALGEKQWWNWTDKDRTLWRHTSKPHWSWLYGAMHANHGFQKMTVG